MTGFVLKNEYIILLGAFWPGVRTPLSPLLPYGDKEERDRIQAVLTPAGLLDRNGNIEAMYHPAMEVISSPVRKIRVDLIRPDHFYAITRYHAHDLKRTFTHIVDEAGTGRGFDEFSMQDIISLPGLEEFSSNGDAVPVDSVLSGPEAWILAAIFDTERSSTLAAITESPNTENISLIPAVCTSAAIGNTLSIFTKKPEDFLYLELLSGIDGRGKIPGSESIGKNLTSLASKGLIHSSGSGYALPAHLLHLVRRSIFLDLTLIASIAQARNDSPVRDESGFCIRADGTLLWFIRPSQAPDQYLLKYLPSDRFRDILEHLFRDSSYSLSGIVVPDAGTETKTKFCSQCGTELRAEAIFCSQCGYRFV